MIVDTHVHVIASDQQRYPLRPSGFGTKWYAEQPVTAEQFAAAMDGAGVERAVLVQAMGAYSYDNAYVTDAARSRPDRFVSVVIVDPSQPDAGATLRRWVDGGGVRGVRLFSIGAPIDDAGARVVWDAAADLALPVVVAVLADQLPRVDALLDRYPQVTVALDHCGFADFGGDAPDLFDLARHPNLYLKLSSIVLESTPDPRLVVARLVAAFGAGRMMWGSDFPQTHDRSYPELLALARDACATLPDHDRHLVLGGTALHVWPELA
jgi:predicted TIM-barrel fold metal-dependent hydrolase